MSEESAILFAISELSKSNADNHSAIIKQITDSHKNTVLQMEAGLNAASISISNLNKTISEHNARLKKAEDLIDKGKVKVAKYDSIIERTKKNRYLLLGGAILFAVIVNFLYDIGAITPILKSLLSKF
jgi:hypothetical protein